MNEQLRLAVPFVPVHELARRYDPPASVEAASDVHGSGRAETEAALVLGCVERHPGLTSAEIAALTEAVGERELEQVAREWRYTVARRLPELEELGLVVATAPAFRIAKPHRDVNPNMTPCAISLRKAIRWRSRGEQT